MAKKKFLHSHAMVFQATGKKKVYFAKLRWKHFLKCSKGHMTYTWRVTWQGVVCVEGGRA